MYIPDKPVLKERPDFVTDIIDASACANINQLTDCYLAAVDANEQKGYIPEYEIYTEDGSYEDYHTVHASFNYRRKPNKEELERINSYNYRMITDYNKFIEDNSEIAKALAMIKYKYVPL